MRVIYVAMSFIIKYMLIDTVVNTTIICFGGKCEVALYSREQKLTLFVICEMYLRLATKLFCLRFDCTEVIYIIDRTFDHNKFDWTRKSEGRVNDVIILPDLFLATYDEVLCGPFLCTVSKLGRSYIL